jgi:SpoVK/Ycf46/Vps4 family AAA+-type ATPase
MTLDSLHTVGEDNDEVAREKIIAEKLAEVRRLLPPKETIESNGPSLEIDNIWLGDALTELEELSFQREQRSILLTNTTERLSALEQALAELDRKDIGTAVTGSRDEAKSRLANILRRDAFAKQSTEGNALSRLWRRFLTWLRGILPKGPSIEPGKANFLSRVAQIAVIGLALAIIAFVVWKLWPRIWRSNPKRKKKGKREARVVLGERLEPDQTSADLLADAEALARDGNIRGAIRKGYIALLCELGDRKILGLAGHKTNRDYLSSVRSHEQLYGEMKFLTFSFENHWYGFVPAELDDWNMFRSRYHQALSQ